MSTGDKSKSNYLVAESHTFASVRLISLTVAVSCVLVAAIGLAAKEVQKSKQGIECQYALWQVADMISIQIRQESLLPESWDSLKEEFLTTNKSYGSFTFEELKTSVYINFELLQKTFEDETSCANKENKSYEFIRCQSSSRKKALLSAETAANSRVLQLLCNLQQDQ